MRGEWDLMVVREVPRGLAAFDTHASPERAAWQAEFAKYQQTPEFQKINSTMTLDEYRQIFYVEYVHRLLARFAGLIVLIPLVYFLVKGIIPWRKSAVYVAIVVLFAFQGVLGACSENNSETTGKI